MPPHKRDPHDRAGIIATAAGILDAYGLADLTMRRLARELDVTAGALYWHFASKQQLLGALADRVLTPVATTAAGPDWRSRIEAVCLQLRDALLSHTDGAELVSASVAAGQSQRAVAILGALADTAGRAGLDAEHAALAARAVLYYVLGAVADEQSRLQWDAAGAAEITPEADPSSAFAFGLGLLVDGLAMRAGLSVS